MVLVGRAPYGAWIEIGNITIDRVYYKFVAPRMARGLKSVILGDVRKHDTVAPRMGRVD